MLQSTNYTFNVTMSYQQPLRVWQPGVLSLSVTPGGEASGSLSIPGWFKEPIPFTGQSLDGYQQINGRIQVSGKSSEASLETAFYLQFDGQLTTATFIGGLTYILDNNMQEWTLYVLSGVTQ